MGHMTLIASYLGFIVNDRLVIQEIQKPYIHEAIAYFNW